MCKEKAGHVKVDGVGLQQAAVVCEGVCNGCVCACSLKYAVLCASFAAKLSCAVCYSSNYTQACDTAFLEIQVVP